MNESNKQPSSQQCIQNLLREEKLCRSCFERFLKIAAILLGRRYGDVMDAVEIEDAAKDAVIAVWRQRKQLRSEAAFTKWFEIIIVRAAQKRLRDEPLEERPTSLDTAFQRPDGSGEKIELPVEDEALQATVFRVALETALNDEKLLTARQVAVVRYRLEGKSYEEIGELMGCTENAAAQVMNAAVTKIEAYLDAKIGQH